MSEKQNKNVTVRVQKIKKNHIKQKLVFFLILAIGLVILAVFSEHLCPYDPYAQDLALAPLITLDSISLPYVSVPIGC